MTGKGKIFIFLFLFFKCQYLAVVVFFKRPSFLLSSLNICVVVVLLAVIDGLFQDQAVV